jgi:hypothetical protein
MKKVQIPTAAVLAALALPAHAGAELRQATITGGGGSTGRCSIVVDVDGSAEVEVSGSAGRLRTISGSEAAWRRFQCSGAMPRDSDIWLAAISGRGNVRLIRQPRNNGGAAIVRIDDPRGGRGNYAFDLQWSGFGGGGGGGGWIPAPIPDHGPGPGGYPMAGVIRMCQDSVTSQLNRSGFRYLTFERAIPLNNPGRHDWVTGNVSGRRGWEAARFSYSCSVDFRSGTVRSIDVQRHGR